MISALWNESQPLDLPWDGPEAFYEWCRERGLEHGQGVNASTVGSFPIGNPEALASKALSLVLGEPVAVHCLTTSRWSKELERWEVVKREPCRTLYGPLYRAVSKRFGRHLTHGCRMDAIPAWLAQVHVESEERFEEQVALASGVITEILAEEREERKDGR